MAGLFEPLEIRSVTLKNRIGCAPVRSYSAEGGALQPSAGQFLIPRAAGGSALVMLDPCAIAAEGRSTLKDAGLWRDVQKKALAGLVSELSSHEALVGVQLTHAGANASRTCPPEPPDIVPEQDGGWSPVAPSPVAADAGGATPRELSKKELQGLVQTFSKAAQRGKDAGCRWFELQLGEGGFLHQLLSPKTNLRRDEYGGSSLNRSRLVMSILEGLRGALGAEMPLGVRLSLSASSDDELDIADLVGIAQLLKSAGIDFVVCCNGSLSGDEGARYVSGRHVELAASLKEQLSLAIFISGEIDDPKAADELIAAGKVDGVFLMRAMLENPHWPFGAARALDATLPWSPKYLEIWPWLGPATLE